MINESHKIKGKYGTCYITDCISGLQELGLPPQHFDLTLTDIPYNIDSGQTKGRGVDIPKRYVELYNDQKTFAEYYAWCKLWFETVMPITKKLIFTCGKYNIGYWQWFFRDIMYDYNDWGLNNSPSRGFITDYQYSEPILFFGKYTQKERWRNNKNKDGNPFYYLCNTGLRENHEFKVWHLVNPKPSYKLKHPHPKPFDMYLDFITHYHPRLACDPCVGSGMNIRVFELLHVKWIAFETNPEYISDIEWNIDVANANPYFFKQIQQPKGSLNKYV